jgi:hypothetical protein
VSVDADPVQAVQDWLQSPGKTTKLLRQKAVVGIGARRCLGTVIWLFA